MHTYPYHSNQLVTLKWLTGHPVRDRCGGYWPRYPSRCPTSIIVWDTRKVKIVDLAQYRTEGGAFRVIAQIRVIPSESEGV